MAFCPVPHTARDQVWLAVGFALGCIVMKVAARSGGAGTSAADDDEDLVWDEGTGTYIKG